jgi:hypothetical protein
VSRSKLRRLHVAIVPAVTTDIGQRRVMFVGVNLLNGVVMVEYDVEPPLDANPFGPRLLALAVTDDVSDEQYPTAWEDFRWRDRGPARVTTRLDRRPPVQARVLHVEVRAADGDDLHATGRVATPVLVRFDVPLPPEHGLPWQPDASSSGV